VHKEVEKKYFVIAIKIEKKIFSFLPEFKKSFERKIIKILREVNWSQKGKFEANR